MFKFLKEKISNWTKSLKKEDEKIEETVEEKTHVSSSSKEKTKKEKKSKEKKTKEKVEENPIQEVPASQEKVIFPEKVEAELDSEIKHKHVEFEEKQIEMPMKFNPALEKYEPDTDKLHEIVKEKSIEEKKGFFSRLKEKATTIQFTDTEFEQQFESLELMLLESNVALEAVDVIKFKLKQKLVGKRILKKEIEGLVSEGLRDSLNELLIDSPDLIHIIRSTDKPYVILFFGINGTGKTTSIAKFAQLLKTKNISCILAAADTFRAASIEQLQKHADKLDIKVIKHDYGSDPAAVAFDAIKHAKAHNIDVVLIDTAGRMHTASNLLKEMEKISRIAKPNLKVFVAEATAGNDTIEQAKNFAESIGIDGSILTKADVDEKGGTIISISHVTRKPILFLGTGQEYKDFEQFSKSKFLERLGL